MTTYSEEFQKRMNDMPDKWTLKWWSEQLNELKRGYRGATHAINACQADYVDTNKTVEQLLAMFDSLEKELGDDKARIGELQAEIVALKQWQERAGEFLNELRKERTNGVTT